MKYTIHGGDVDLISRMYGIEKEKIINFSGNVSPMGLPFSVRNVITNNIDCICEYPDVTYLSLKEAIGEYSGANPKNITVGNGSTELISHFIAAVNPQKSIVVSPAYSEYIKEIKNCGGAFSLFELQEKDDFILNIDELLKIIDSDTDMLVLCNPNNPTGTYVTEENLKIILQKCRETDTFVFIDETYVEFADDNVNISGVALTDEFDNLCVIRGTSKFFCCPGLRLGYAICSNSKICDIVNGRKDSWSVNSFAELCGKTMFKDKEFIKNSRSFISSERKRICDILIDFKNIYVYKTQSNFFLLKILKEGVTSKDVFDKLIKKNILIRNAEDFPFLSDRFIRFCILLKDENDMLLNELRKITE